MAGLTNRQIVMLRQAARVFDEGRDPDGRRTWRISVLGVFQMRFLETSNRNVIPLHEAIVPGSPLGLTFRQILMEYLEQHAEVRRQRAHERKLELRGYLDGKQGRAVAVTLMTDAAFDVYLAAYLRGWSAPLKVVRFES